MKKGSHDSCPVSVYITNHARVIVRCLAHNHPANTNGMEFAVDFKHHSNIATLLHHVWGLAAWFKAFDTKFLFITSTPCPGKNILEPYSKSGSNYVRYHAITDLERRFANSRAYCLNVKKEDDKPGAKDQQANGTKQESQGLLSNTNLMVDTPTQPNSKIVVNISRIFQTWFCNSEYRQNFNGVVFLPQPLQSISQYDQHSSSRLVDGDYNIWCGFGVKAKPSNDPCPLLRAHIFHAMVSADKLHFHYLVTLMAWMVQRPHIKTQICVVLKSNQGAGKNSLGDVLLKIFGPFGIQVTHNHHVLGRFNGHLQNKVFVLLNEALWPGDRAGDGFFKAAVTEKNYIEEKKGKDGVPVDQFWNLWIFSNNDFCAPMSIDNRRVFVPSVSNAYINNKSYFKRLHEEIDNGGTEEFLHYLMQHPIPEDWTPWSRLPQFTPAGFQILLADRSNAAFKWFLEKVRLGEWEEEIRDYRGNSIYIKVILSEQENEISSESLLLVFHEAAKSNESLRKYSKIETFTDVHKFFEVILNNQLFEKTIVNRKTKPVNGYKFQPMTKIRDYLETRWNIELDEEHPRKRPKGNVVLYTIV